MYTYLPREVVDFDFTVHTPELGRSIDRRLTSKASLSPSMCTRTSRRRPIGTPWSSKSWAAVKNRDWSLATQCGSMRDDR